MSETTYKGKIGRLPRKLRDEVCQRMNNGESGRKILPWLNRQPECREVMKFYFKGEPVNDANLSEWRATGYQDWLRREEREERLGRLCQWALKAGGGRAGDAASAIAAGQLLEALEDFDPETLSALIKTDPTNHAEVVKALAALRRSDAAVLTAQKLEEKLKQAEAALRLANERLALERERFRFQAAEAVEKLGVKKLRDVLESKDARPVKMEKLVKLMFGDRPAEPVGPLQIPGGKAPAGAR